MASESTPGATRSTLLEALVARSGLPWRGIAIAAGLVLLLLSVVAAYLDGLLTGPISGGYRYLLMAPVLVPYLLLTQPPLRRLREAAIDAFRSLVPFDDERYDRTLAEAPMFNRLREWVALGIGAAASPLLTRAAWPFFPLWTKAYVILAGAVLFGLLGWSLYSTLAGTRLFSEARTRPEGVNVFELAFLEPIGRWSLGVALSYVGGITLTLLFLPPPARTVETVVMFGLCLLAPVLVFFVNMMSARRIVVRAKRQEMTMVHDGLRAASHAMKAQAAQGDPQEMSVLLGQFTAWVAVEQRVKQVPEWPYTASIRQGLALSLLLPVVIGALQGLLAEAIMDMVR
ncbi:MAG: hypothetical protein PVH41_01880 [Anaerolineae bacterium]